MRKYSWSSACLNDTELAIFVWHCQFQWPCSGIDKALSTLDTCIVIVLLVTSTALFETKMCLTTSESNSANVCQFVRIIFSNSCFVCSYFPYRATSSSELFITLPGMGEEGGVGKEMRSWPTRWNCPSIRLGRPWKPRKPWSRQPTLGIEPQVYRMPNGRRISTFGVRLGKTPPFRFEKVV